MTKVSVIIPLLNKGIHVKRALDSVLDQTFQDFEVIVVDGGSTDSGPDVVKNLTDKRIRFMQQESKGVSAARNQGVYISKGDLITFLDADDEWMPLHLETLLKMRNKYPEAGAYTTAYKIMLQNGILRWAEYACLPPAPWEGMIPNYFRSAARGEYPVWTSVVCIPRDIFMEFSGFPEGSSYGEDADLFGKIALKYPIAFSWYMGGIYHWGAVNRICDNVISLNEEPFVRTAKTAISDGLVPLDKMDDLNEYIANKEINRAKRHVDAGKPKEARRILCENKTRYQRKRVFFMKLKTMLPYNVYQKLRTIKRSSL
jgi:glycosyltransferase involved in cell wall biosynthesis